MLLVYLAQQGPQHCAATDVAAGTHVALPTTKKLLTVLARAGLVEATRGSEGGYRLARPAASISAAEIVKVIEGPVAITECSTDASQCELESMCLVGGAWQKINQAVLAALEDISLQELQRPALDAVRPKPRRQMEASEQSIIAREYRK